jgi:hypothetical protein
MVLFSRYDKFSIFLVVFYSLPVLFTIFVVRYLVFSVSHMYFLYFLWSAGPWILFVLFVRISSCSSFSHTFFVAVCSPSQFSQFSSPRLFRCQRHWRVRLRSVSYTAECGSALAVTQCRFACPQSQVTLCSSAEFVNTLQNQSPWRGVSYTAESDPRLSVEHALQRLRKHSLCWLTLQCHSYIHNFLTAWNIKIVIFLRNYRWYLWTVAVKRVFNSASWQWGSAWCLALLGTDRNV